MKVGPLTLLALVAGAYYLGREAAKREVETGLPVSPFMQLEELTSQAKQQYNQLQQQYSTGFYAPSEVN